MNCPGASEAEGVGEPLPCTKDGPRGKPGLSRLRADSGLSLHTCLQRQSDNSSVFLKFKCFDHYRRNSSHHVAGCMLQYLWLELVQADPTTCISCVLLLPGNAGGEDATPSSTGPSDTRILHKCVCSLLRALPREDGPSRARLLCPQSRAS